MLGLLFCFAVFLIYKPYLQFKYSIKPGWFNQILVGFSLLFFDYVLMLFLGHKYLFQAEGIFHRLNTYLIIITFWGIWRFCYFKKYKPALEPLLLLIPFAFYFAIQTLSSTLSKIRIFGFRVTPLSTFDSSVLALYLIVLAAILIFVSKQKTKRLAASLTLTIFFIQVSAGAIVKSYIGGNIYPSNLFSLAWQSVNISDQWYIQEEYSLFKNEKEAEKINIANDLELVSSFLGNPFIKEIVEDYLFVPKYKVSVKEEGTIIEAEELVALNLVQTEKLTLFLDRSGNIINTEFRFKTIFSSK